MKISLIAAMAKNRCIGLKNDLPWNIPEDMKYFRDTTRGHPVVMGRKTFESMGRKPLPKRDNLVITRQENYPSGGARIFGSLDVALEDLKTQETSKWSSAEDETEIFVIGGEQIYRQAVPFADRIYLTVIDQDFEGDTFFPEWDETQFQEVSSRASCDDELSYRFLIFERK